MEGTRPNFLKSGISFEMKNNSQIDSKNQLNKFLLFISISILTSGCATMRTNTNNSQSSNDAIGNVIKDSSPNKDQSNKNPTVATNTALPTFIMEDEIAGRKLKVNRFDYPIMSNAAVEKWITYFTGKGRFYFSKYLERGRYFIPEIAKVLKQNNMPQDLVYLAMIESGFNNSARSHAKAVGPWQFIKGTGKRYGLTINYWLDERRDTKKATMAAIAYLRELYEEFGSWELAAAGYNAGEGKVRRAIRKYRSSDFWYIAKHRFFRHETRDYVPKIMAAAIITKNPELFGFEDPFNKGSNPVLNPTTNLLANDTIGNKVSEEPTPKELEDEIAKADAVEDTTEDPADQGDEVATAEPEEDEDLADEDATDSDHATVSKAPEPTFTPSIYMVLNPNEQIIEFEVKGPADLFAVSKAAGIPYSTIKLLNPELSRWITPPNMKSYRIKLPLSSKDRFLATYNDDSFDRKVVFQPYTVKSGDNIQKIAKKYLTETDPIRELNNLPAGSTYVRVGTTILLPVPMGYKRVIASMYDEKPSSDKKRRRYRKSHRARVRAKTSFTESSRYAPKNSFMKVSGTKKTKQRKSTRVLAD